MQFSLEQRNLVVQAIGDAEDRTAKYYCIPPFRWQKLAYDLLTRQDHEWNPLPESILAQVVRLHRISPKPSGSFEFFRIQLNDPSILNLIQREKLGDVMYHFLVYILTHEMVHMVRLSSILEDEPAAPHASENEESRVQKISRQILNGNEFKKFQPILDQFCIV